MFLLLITFFIVVSFGSFAQAASKHEVIYDGAHLLKDNEKAKLESLSSKLGKDRKTDFLIITVNGTDGKTLEDYVEDFYDKEAPGYDKKHGNTAILAIDMKDRDVYLAGFEKAEDYLDSDRMNQIREAITPALSDGDYYKAFSDFIQKAHDYMGYKPGVNPNSILFKWWFQIAASLFIALIVVGLMAYRSGGRVTVNARTYLDNQHSGVVSDYDNFLRRTVTRRRKPSNNSKDGGGGGVTPGGHSHSGSSGKF
nr:TPM domain-containing protein [Pullulanibacillus pueri]